jgi:hypothetical protein
MKGERESESERILMHLLMRGMLLLQGTLANQK